MAGLGVSFHFGLGHAEFEVSLRCYARMLSRPHTRAHSVIQEDLQGCPGPLGSCWDHSNAQQLLPRLVLSPGGRAGSPWRGFLRAVVPKRTPFTGRWSEILDSGFIYSQLFLLHGRDSA